MQKFYATFMQKQAFNRHYVTIIADNESIARDAMDEHFGNKWGFMYDASRFRGQTEEYGLKELCRIAVTHYGEHQRDEYQLTEEK